MIINISSFHRRTLNLSKKFLFNVTLNRYEHKTANSQLATPNSSEKNENEIQINSTSANSNEKVVSASNFNRTPVLFDEDQINKKQTFASLFRHSKFTALGDLKNKYLIGRIVEVVGDDLYIDFGGKFNCICKRPNKSSDFYQRNANVIIKLLDFEMASYFISASKHLTLLESNASLIGPFSGGSIDKDQRGQEFKNEVDELNSDSFY